ncbi:hypothetical protein HDV00_002917 [Rhizophlyctis rosea]|nr:hypothetical protein HDV00_002917 [Rhizophlyctis rosea]
MPGQQPGDPSALFDGTKLNLNHPIVMDEEDILTSYFEEKKIESKNDRIFLIETFKGCVRHRNIIEIATIDFLHKTGDQYLRTDYNLFAVLLYLALYRLDDLTFENFRHFITCHDPVTMARLIAFLFNPANLQGDQTAVGNTEPDAEMQTQQEGLVAKWGKVVDLEYVQARPIPKCVYTGTGERELLEKLKQENREKKQEFYAKAEKEQFTLLTRKPPEKAQKHQPTKAPSPSETPLIRPYKPVPPTTHANVTIKLTTAAILREDALMKKQRKEEERSLAGVEMGLAGKADFEGWKEERRVKDDEARRLEMERRRLEIQLMHEEAFEAKQEVVKENRHRASSLQSELHSLKLLSQHLSHLHHIQNRARVTSIQSIQPAIELARSQVISTNHTKAQVLAQEKEEMKIKAMKEAQEEMERKMELIAQIRLLERSVPKVGEVVKMVDLTETSGIGLLGEMSVIELQERLVLAKNRKRDWEQAKRAEIVSQKQTKVEEIARKLDEIDRERQERRRARKRKDQDYETRSTGSYSPTPSSASERSKAPASQDPVLKELQAKLEAKKADLDAAEKAFEQRRRDLRAQQELLLEEIAKVQGRRASEEDEDNEELEFDRTDVATTTGGYGFRDAGMERKGGMVRV